MDIKKATERYEAWLRSSLPMVIEADLEFKHEQMAAAVFPFLRATFYRWAERWPNVCPQLVTAPVVLGVGDLHVENYGTWRDAEGRLVWGINDFDEATNLPYPVDLVRLATSVVLAIDDHSFSARPLDAAEAILAGYQEGLKGGKPFVLAERHSKLRALATGELREPVKFWDKMDALPEAPEADYPPEAIKTVMAALPGHEQSPGPASLRCRRAGLGSLGRPRLVALAEHQGGKVAREVKALLPSAWDWVATTPNPVIHYGEVTGRAVRCPDPGTAVRDGWLVRRLAPDCARIELADLPAQRDESTLLHSMGFELANIHLGTAGAALAIAQDLESRAGAALAIAEDLESRAQHHQGWLAEAADRMAADTKDDWDAWRKLTPA